MLADLPPLLRDCEAATSSRVQLGVALKFPFGSDGQCHVTGLSRCRGGRLDVGSLGGDDFPRYFGLFC